MISRISRASDSVWQRTAASDPDDLGHLDFDPHPYEEDAGSREELRRKLPPGAMRDEPTSDAERNDLYWHGDPMLREYTNETKRNLDAVHAWRKQDAKKLYKLWDESGFTPGQPLVEGMSPKTEEIAPGIHRVQADLPESVRAHLANRGGPGDALIAGNGHDEDENDDVERDQWGYKPSFYRVWHENGDYLGGSFDEDRANEIKRGHILNHLWETRDDDLPNWHHDSERIGPYCAGCGVMTPPHDHGFSVDEVQDDDPQPPEHEHEEDY